MTNGISGTSGVLAAMVICAAVPLWGAGYGQLPLTFEANCGQASGSIHYLARGQGYGLFLDQNSAALRLISKSRVADLRMRFSGGAANPAIAGEVPLPGLTHHYRGPDPRQWIADVPTFARVRYSAVYPGVDLIFYGNQRSLEYDFVVTPGADPRSIAIAFDGADRTRIDRGGDLLLTVAGGQVRLLKPVAYQDIGGARKPVSARYRLHKDRVSFALGSYDVTRPLIIDPVLNYSSYLGGSGLDGATAVAVDAIGNAYIAGWTASANFPATSGAYQTASAGLTDAFVTKIDPLGQTRLFSTFLGGSSDDTAEGVAVDAVGNVYVVGSTQSANFPTLNASQAYGGSGDGFIAKLTPSGALSYSTFLGGNAIDDARAIAVDAAGNAYITGMTESANFPVTPGSYQTSPGGASDGFVMKRGPSGSTIYSTLLGGSGTDEANAIAIDSNGNAWVAGVTWSSAFPTKNPLQAYGGSEDAFVTKLNLGGTGLLFSTFLGGNSLDAANAIAVDGSGNAYVAGGTSSLNFPVTAGVLQAAASGFFSGEDAFVVKYNAAGTQVMYSTYLGGSRDDIANAITVDAQGFAYLAGETSSSNFPVLNSLQSYAGGTEAFVTVVNANATALVFSTFLGGTGNESAKGIAADGNGRIYVAGETNSTNFPIIPAGVALQPAVGGGIEDAFVAAMQYCSYSLGVIGSPFPSNGGTGSLVITAAPGCPWSAASTVPWITPINPISGTGNGTVGFTVAPNAGQQTLTGALTAGWQSVPVTETAISCNFTLSATAASAGATGGVASFTVTPSPLSCTWTASSNAPWINITGGSPGTGAGTVTYSVAVTTSLGQRAGTITVGGQTFTITQQGGTPQFSLNPTSASPSGAAGTASVGVVCNLTDAPWTAASNDSWLTVTSGTPGTGNGTVGYSFTANTLLTPRTGTLTIAGSTFTITQGGATSFTLNPTFSNVTAIAGTGSIAVSASPLTANWNAVSNVSWIVITSGSAGTGNGTVNYSVAANNSIVGRVGTLTVAGQTFTVTQAGAISSFSLTPPSATASAAATTGVVAVTAAPADATWTSISNSSFLTITSGASGTGNGTVNYSVAANTGSGRAGTLTVAGQTFTVSQAAAPSRTIVLLKRNATDATVDYFRNLLTTSGLAFTELTASQITTSSLANSVIIAGFSAQPTEFNSVASTIAAAVNGGSWLFVDAYGKYVLSTAGIGTVSTGSTNPVVLDKHAFVKPIDASNLFDGITIWDPPTTPDRPELYTDYYLQTGGYSLIFYNPPAGAQSVRFWTLTMTYDWPFNATDSSYCQSWGGCTGERTVVQSSVALMNQGGGKILVGTDLIGIVAGRFQLGPVSDAIFKNFIIQALAVSVPALAVNKSHSGNFSQGQLGAPYTITVSNGTSAGPTAGIVTVTETLPTGMALASMSGAGWTCAALSCTRSDSLAAGASYPAITVSVNVAANAASPLVNQASVSGGGSISVSASDSTIVTIGQPPAAVTVFTPAQGASVPTTTGLTWGAVSGATSYDVYFGSIFPPPLAGTTTATTYTPAGMTAGLTYYWSVTAKNTFGSTPSALWVFTTTQATSGLRFVPVTPCRVMDTRGSTGTFGGPILPTGGTRNVPIPQSTCGIPSSALAYSLNITVVPPGSLTYLSIWPAGQPQPNVSTLNSFDGRIVANAAIVPAGTSGAVSVFVSDASHVIIDINGYFAPASTAGAQAFYSATPCRVADTRAPVGPFGGPLMPGGSTRNISIPSSSCGIPAGAQAYSLNITVLPRGPLAYLSTWPTGQPQPVVSTLNSFDGSVVANAAIVPAGTNGAISVFVTDNTDVIIDINGYFAPPGSAGALSLYPLTPCRVADTRNGSGSFGGPIVPGAGSRSFPIPSSACGLPASAQAYSFNVTAVPPGPLIYLTAWPAGQPQPGVSTLNSFAGKVVANAAIVPAGTAGAVSIFVSDTSHVILDINAYFAQ